MPGTPAIANDGMAAGSCGISQLNSRGSAMLDVIGDWTGTGSASGCGARTCGAGRAGLCGRTADWTLTGLGMDGGTGGGAAGCEGAGDWDCWLRFFSSSSKKRRKSSCGLTGSPARPGGGGGGGAEGSDLRLLATAWMINQATTAMMPMMVSKSVTAMGPMNIRYRSPASCGLYGDGHTGVSVPTVMDY